ncbi:hypothetical protein CEXT_603271 [Caerostris extrusa]|uniref:Uncharacterized protein n=1 Tax=Caerostris extrusa TaxID=172846 RepID=A0AAV4WBN1_CAEEX|nr:hypothetical protein CEXT_603271 [Caerostris extrusa]
MLSSDLLISRPAKPIPAISNAEILLTLFFGIIAEGHYIHPAKLFIHHAIEDLTYLAGPDSPSFISFTSEAAREYFSYRFFFSFGYPKIFC